MGICFVHAGKYADIECLNTNEVLGAVSDRRGEVEVFEINPADMAELENAISRISRFLGYTKNAVSCAAR